MHTTDQQAMLAEFYQVYGIDRATPETRNALIDRCHNLIREEHNEVLDAQIQLIDARYNDSGVREAAAHLVKEWGDLLFVNDYAVYGLAVDKGEASDGIHSINDAAVEVLARLRLLQRTAPGSGEEGTARYRLARACATLDAAVYRTAAKDGIDMLEVFREVHRSNLDKVWDDGQIHRRDDGKILKPPNWRAPDMAGFVGELAA